MAEEGGLKKMVDNPFGGDGIAAFQYYRRHDVTSIQVEDYCCCKMGNWVMQKTDQTTEPTNGAMVCSPYEFSVLADVTCVGRN
jgi:hypothetical protein